MFVHRSYRSGSSSNSMWWKDAACVGAGVLGFLIAGFGVAFLLVKMAGILLR